MLLVQKNRKKYSDPFYWTQKQFGLQGQSAGFFMLVVWERGSLKQCHKEPNAENIEKKTHKQKGLVPRTWSQLISRMALQLVPGWEGRDSQKNCWHKTITKDANAPQPLEHTVAFQTNPPFLNSLSRACPERSVA